MFRQQFGVELSRKTMGNWVEQAAELLKPVYRTVREDLLRGMPTDFLTPRVLSRSGLTVGRLGLGSSYGAPASTYERAFERGCNYFSWGSVRRKGMGAAIRNLASRHRERIVVVLQSYSRNGLWLRHRTESGLRGLRLDYADILLLGWHNEPLSPRLMEAALLLQ